VKKTEFEQNLTIKDKYPQLVIFSFKSGLYVLLGCQDLLWHLFCYFGSSLGLRWRHQPVSMLNMHGQRQTQNMGSG